MKERLLLLSFLSIAACAAPQKPAVAGGGDGDGAPAAGEGASAADEPRERIVCELEAPTGSNMMKRVCHSVPVR
jgi:hypothetical protein